MTFDSILTGAQNAAASIFWFLVVVGVLVFLHESGHFLTAKLFGMRVDVFSLGFGKALFGVKRGQTEYRISLLPLGGYVKLAGGEEAGEPVAGKEGEPRGEPPPRESLPADYFLARPRWQRFLVLVMGATVNIFLAVFLFSLTFYMGVDVPRPSKPLVRIIEERSPAATAGLQAGDLITHIDGEPIAVWEDVGKSLIRSGSKAMRVAVERGGQKLELDLTPALGPDGAPAIGARGGQPAIIASPDPEFPAAKAGLREDDRIEAIDGVPVADYTEVATTIHKSVGKELDLSVRRGDELLDVRVTPVRSKLPDGREVGRLGFAFKSETDFVKLAPFPALRKGVETSVELAGSLFHVFKNLIKRDLPFSTLSGPIEIAKMSRAFAESAVSLFRWMAFISLQLGIINLLPIPVLDGGHIFILLTEGVLRRDLSFNLKERLTQLGLVFLVVLMAAVLFQDILKNIS